VLDMGEGEGVAGASEQVMRERHEKEYSGTVLQASRV